MTPKRQKLFVVFIAGIILLLAILTPIAFRFSELRTSTVPARCRSSLRAELNPLENILTFYLDIDFSPTGSSSVTSRTFFNLPINTFYTGQLEGVSEDQC